MMRNLYSSTYVSTWRQHIRFAGVFTRECIIYGAIRKWVALEKYHIKNTKNKYIYISIKTASRPYFLQHPLQSLHSFSAHKFVSSIYKSNSSCQLSQLSTKLANCTNVDFLLTQIESQLQMTHIICAHKPLLISKYAKHNIFAHFRFRSLIAYKYSPLISAATQQQQA